MLEQIERIKNRLQCVYKHTQMMPMLLLNLPMYMMPWSKDLLTWFVPKSRNRLSTYHHFISFPLIFPPTPSRKGPVWEFHQLRISFPRVFPQVFAVFPSPTRPHYAVERRGSPRWTNPRVAAKCCCGAKMWRCDTTTWTRRRMVGGREFWGGRRSLIHHWYILI